MGILAGYRSKQITLVSVGSQHIASIGKFPFLVLVSKFTMNYKNTLVPGSKVGLWIITRTSGRGGGEQLQWTMLSEPLAYNLLG